MSGPGTSAAPTKPFWLARSWLVAVAVFVLLGSLTWRVWREQVDHQDQLVTRHMEDISVQAARRLEVYLASRLAVANVFALRWSEHQHRDFSRERFEDFAGVLIREFPSYHAVAILLPDRREHWSVPPGDLPMASFLETNALDDAASGGLDLLTPPVQVADDEISLFYALPLSRGEELLGTLVVELRARSLIDDCFHEHIRSETAFRIRADGEIFYEFAPDDADRTRMDAGEGASTSFRIEDQTWEMQVVPRGAALTPTSRGLDTAALGLGLSLALSWLAWLLLRRIDALDDARHQALWEVQERRRTQEQLEASRTRYHRVYDSASDALIVLDSDGTVVEANPAAHDILGRDHLAGAGFASLFPGDQQHRVGDWIDGLGQSGSHLSTRYDRSDGRAIDLDLSGAWFGDEGPDLRLVIASDVTLRRQAMRQKTMLSRRVLLAQEEERARLSRDLHDGLGQLLTATHLELDLARRQHPSSESTADAPLGRALTALQEAGRELRQICRGLRPATLDDLGLVPALTQLCADFEDRMRIPVDLEVRGLEDGADLVPEISICVYRVLQEALTNVGRHARASSVEVTLRRGSFGLELTVQDDGVGFDLRALSDRAGLGLAGMRERAELVNGSFEIRSVPGQGTRVRLSTSDVPPIMKEETT